mgnify:FL=1
MSNLKPNQFTDGNGRAWTFRFTFLDVKRIRHETGVDIMSLWQPDSEDAAELAQDPILLVDVLWCALEPQAKAAGVTPEDFGAGLVGDPIADAYHALIEGAIDFFPDQGRRELLRATRRRLAAMDARAMAMAKQMLTETGGGSSGNTLEPAASIPTRTPSAS